METNNHIVEVTVADLPVSCPRIQAGVALWSSHPRVYLDMAQGEQTCPYCGTHYRIKAGEPNRNKHQT